MTTQKQINANRLNAQKSTGPKTSEGLAVVSKNAFSTGLYSGQAVLMDENHDDYERLKSRMFTDLAPVGEVEAALAERIVSLIWRLKRAGRIETAVLNVLSRECWAIDCVRHYLDSFSNPVITQNIPTTQTPGMSCQDVLLAYATKQDLSDSNVIPRILKYETQLERNLYKAILELQKLQFIRKRNQAIDAQPHPADAGKNTTENRTLPDPKNAI